MTWMWARGKPSGSSMTRPSALIAPLTPYVPGSPLWSTSRSQGLLEIPICVAPGLRLPIIGTSLHLFGKRGLDLILPLVMRTHRDILNMEFHAIDFMDQDDPGTEGLSEKQPDLAIPWTKKLLVYDHFMASISNEYTFVTLREATRRWRLSTAPQ
jgi:hypothetical protein